MTKEDITQKIEELNKERNSLPICDVNRSRIMDKIAALGAMRFWH